MASGDVCMELPTHCHPMRNVPAVTLCLLCNLMQVAQNSLTQACMPIKPPHSILCPNPARMDAVWDVWFLHHRRYRISGFVLNVSGARSPSSAL